MSFVPDNASTAPQPGEWTPLLARVRQRDEDAARLVVERLHNHVLRIVLAHLPRRDDPEDVMQEVFMKVFHKLDSFRGAVPFEHWVARIALLTCIDRLRRQRVRPELRWADLTEEEIELMQTIADESDPPVASADAARELIEKLLAQLKPEEQWIIRWLDLEERTIAEIREATGWSHGVTRIRAFRARRKLKALYRQLERQDT